MESNGETDSITEFQQKLDEFAVMMYSYIGILQRDALPAGSSDKDVKVEDLKLREDRRKELEQQAVEYATNIVKTAEDVDDTITNIEKEVENTAEGIEIGIREANEVSKQVGVKLKSKSERVRQTMESIRVAFEEIEKQEDTSNSYS
ncbi:hypothetical protein NDN08_003028 [Rhodosorus marinus]|uniref:Mediator of RNA polymerase II transcription subunit 21 n=1 Tax=Rhodosorus marinus TaxID=101924 RepID=A0AAV8UVN3_9RHOD|nr:hypothetical protein NDN08_003028 [Rhodosorus marinus]